MASSSTIVRPCRINKKAIRSLVHRGYDQFRATTPPVIANFPVTRIVITRVELRSTIVRYFSTPCKTSSFSMFLSMFKGNITNNFSIPFLSDRALDRRYDRRRSVCNNFRFFFFFFCTFAKLQNLFLKNHCDLILRISVYSVV